MVALPAPSPGELTELGDIPLFHGLAPIDLARLRHVLHRRTVPAGTTLTLVEQPGEAAYVILSGTVKIHVEQKDGGDVILAVLGPGEVVGEMSLIDQLARSATVVTLEETSFLWIDRATFADCLRSMPALAFNLLAILSRRLRFNNAQLQSLARLDVYGRVARQILSFAEQYGRPVSPAGPAGGSRAPGGNRPDEAIEIPLRLTQTDLADLVGASRVRVNQVLGFYKQRGFISIDHEHRITVLNRAALAQRCE